jgi:hypothetical protein
MTMLMIFVLTPTMFSNVAFPTQSKQHNQPKKKKRFLMVLVQIALILHPLVNRSFAFASQRSRKRQDALIGVLERASRDVQRFAQIANHLRIQVVD